MKVGRFISFFAFAYLVILTTGVYAGTGYCCSFTGKCPWYATHTQTMHGHTCPAGSYNIGRAQTCEGYSESSRGFKEYNVDCGKVCREVRRKEYRECISKCEGRSYPYANCYGKTVETY